MAVPMLSEDEIFTLLTLTPDKLATFSTRFSGAALSRVPASQEWSLNHVLAHLRSCADVWGDAIARILAEDHPTIRALHPSAWLLQTDYPDLPFQESAAAYTAQRHAFLDRLRRLQPADWHRAATITGAGAPLQRTVAFYASKMARHERQHHRQLDHIAAALEP